jgi:N-acetylmuramoyl-L-alanine amidase
MAGNSANVAEMEEAAALMRDAGLTVLASSGWKDRGRSSDLYPWALIAHHTAATDDITSMLINGRSDLPGPLCNFELREYGDWNLIASGRANHAGEASVTNSESYGIEATGPQNYPDTYGPAAFPHNYNSYEVGCACILAAMGAALDDLMGHKEIAPTRKIDPYFDMGAFRKGVDTAELEDDMTPTEALEQSRKALVTTTGMTVNGGSLFSKTNDIQGGVDRMEPLLNQVNTKLDELLALLQSARS